MDWLMNLLGLGTPKPPHVNPLPERTDEQLEAFIDAVGRDAVFARARAYGWSVGNKPPKWVWGEICHEIMQEKMAWHHCQDERAGLI